MGLASQSIKFVRSARDAHGTALFPTFKGLGERRPTAHGLLLRGVWVGAWPGLYVSSGTAVFWEGPCPYRVLWPHDRQPWCPS